MSRHLAQPYFQRLLAAGVEHTSTLKINTGNQIMSSPPAYQVSQNKFGIIDGVSKVPSGFREKYKTHRYTIVLAPIGIEPITVFNAPGIIG